MERCSSTRWPASWKLNSLQPVVFVGENHFSSSHPPSAFAEVVPTLCRKWCFRRTLPYRAKIAHRGRSHGSLSSMVLRVWQTLIGYLPQMTLLFACWRMIISFMDRAKRSRNRPQLRNELEKVADCIETRSATPWLCWPEGKWSKSRLISQISRFCYANWFDTGATSW